MYEHLSLGLWISMIRCMTLNKCRSLWPIFHGPVVLPYILKTDWCINIMLREYQSVWPNIWPQNKCRSPWPIFHFPLIFLIPFKSVWCMNIILWDYEIVWHDIWPKNKCRSLWPIFHGPVILPSILKTIWYNIWTSYFGIISQNDPMFDLKIFVGHWPIFHGPLILPYFLKIIQWQNIILRDYEPAWPDIWPQNKCRSLWPIFDEWMSYFRKMSQSDTTFDLKINLVHSDLYFMVQCFFYFLPWKTF